MPENTNTPAVVPNGKQTLRQKLSKRVAATGRRLLGLEADRTVLENRFERLELAVNELLLHGRRMAQVESRIEQTHKRLNGVEGLVAVVQAATQSVPLISDTTQNLVTSLSSTSKELAMRIEASSDVGRKDLETVSASLHGAQSALLITAQSIEGHQVETKTGVAALHHDLTGTAKQLSEQHTQTKTGISALHHDLTGTAQQLSEQHTQTKTGIAALHHDLTGTAQQLSEQHTQTKTGIAALHQDLTGTAKQLSEQHTQTKTGIAALHHDLTGTAQQLSEQQVATKDGLAALHEDVTAIGERLFDEQSKTKIGLEALQAASLKIAEDGHALADIINQMSLALAAAGTANSVMGNEQRAQLENLMGEAFVRLDSQTMDIRHAHKILLQQPIYTAPGMNAVVRVGGWDGHPIAVPTSHAAVVHGHYTNGAASGEPGVRAAIRSLVRPGMTAIDIGAHVGLHSVIIGFHVGDEGKLICFEPDPELAGALTQTMLMNGFAHKARVINAAVADAQMKMSFHRTPHSPESTLFPAKGMIMRDSIEVDVVSLDSVLPKGSVVNFLKIDAEGAEARIYRGMKRILAENRDISMIVEFAPEHFKRAGDNPAAYLVQAIKDGFSLSIIDEPDGTITAATPTKILKLPTCNLLLSRG